ncbi:Serine-threonine protein kinase 19 [Penicillium hispanicum]|uniref:Serine-threonine protein kinase 19 n=1 Tax=Penicillium hispanicum TaxID=1080232 RepID=UPI0025412FCE|nr:Serine-threonine protein kinase 19 [Penicillium hispanicum]KAJ5577861.1 Serine-threonine protein kinase 19 [Penicillium hispanicum]
MTLRLTSAPVSGVKKRKAGAPRPRASPFAAHARRKPAAGAANAVKAAAAEAEWDLDDPLPDEGATHFISETTPVDDVVQAIQYIRVKMFDELPARAGMNSTRIAEVLNLRRSLPPLASVAHVHTLLNAPTQVEREIVQLVQSGRVRRLIIPGRGNDAAGLGDCLVLSEDWEELVRESPALDSPVKEKFLDILNRIGTYSAISQGLFTPDEYKALVRAGFLVSSSSLTQGSLSVASLPNLPGAAVSSASRSGPAQASDTNRSVQTDAQARAATLFLSLPNTGTYLRLLGTGRAHLLALLRRSKCGEAPLHLLKDRWDGAVETDKSFHLAKRARGEFAGILPGKTKKWKDLYGMQFRWILEEALGAGLVEIFETGSVGPGVRSFELLNSIPSTFTADPKPRSSPPSKSKIKLLRRWRKPAELGDHAKNKPEFWVCRQSEHVDSNTSGTASWSEFEAGLRHDHAEHEMEYTPSVSSVKRLLQWDEQTIGEVDVDGNRLHNILVEINLITHSFHPSALISPRSFTSLTISASYELSPSKSFITVQIPFCPDASSTPTDLYQQITSAVPRRAIFANYASVERVMLLPASSPQSSEPRRIEWIMATTSDAGGSIPQWVQRNWTLGGVPRAVVADVGLFIGWTMRRREESGAAGVHTDPRQQGGH